jgi:hypothetical protein
MFLVTFHYWIHRIDIDPSVPRTMLIECAKMLIIHEQFDMGALFLIKAECRKEVPLSMAFMKRHS